MSFESKLQTKRLVGRSWQLTEELRYKTKKGGLIIVPKDFVTDYASVPRFLHWLLRPDGNYKSAAVVHDWIYKKNCSYSRKEADLLFKEAMESLSIEFWKVSLLYLGVRSFGWAVWKQKK